MFLDEKQDPVHILQKKARLRGIYADYNIFPRISGVRYNL